jgi:hypothetical protein
MELKLINGTKKAPRFTQEQLAQKHFNMSMEGLEAYYTSHSRWHLRKCVSNAVRYAVYRYRTLKENGTPLGYTALFNMQDAVMGFLELLTPRELLTDFPITKTYDGKRWESADYFTTIEKFEGLDMDKPFDKQVKEMAEWLWGYQNKWLSMFLVGFFCTIDKIRQMNGEEDMLTGFFKSQGKKPPETIRVYKDAKGKKYAVDSNGKSMPLRKAKPRYLRVLK